VVLTREALRVEEDPVADPEPAGKQVPGVLHRFRRRTPEESVGQNQLNGSVVQADGQGTTAPPPPAEEERVRHEPMGRTGLIRWLYRGADGAAVAVPHTVCEHRESRPATETPAEREPEPDPGPRAATELVPAPEDSSQVPAFVEYIPSAAGGYVLGGVVVVASVAAVVTLFVAAAEPDPGGLLLAVCLGALAALAEWALSNWTPTIISIRKGDLVMARGSRVRYFDLRDPETRVELGEQPGLLRWRTTVTDRKGRQAVIGARQVNARHFIEMVEYHSGRDRNGERRRVDYVRWHLPTSTLWVFLGFGTLAVGSLVVNSLLTRTMPPQSVGVYFLAVSIVTFAATAGRAGLNQAVIRLIARAESDRTAVAGVWVRTALVVAAATAAAASAFLVFVAVPPLASTVFNSPRLAQIGVLLGCWSFFEALRLVASEALRGFGRIGAATLLGDAGRQVLFGATLSAAFLATGGLTLDLVVGSAIASAAVVLVVALWLLRARLAQPSSAATWSMASKTLRVSLPIMVTSLALLAVTLGDVWLAGILLPDADVGVYAATARLVLLVLFPLHISNVVLSPVVARLYARRQISDLERAVRVGATVAALPTVAIVGTLLLYGGPILGLVYGDAYRDGAAVLRILACGQIVNALAGVCGQVLLMTGHQRTMMRVTVLGGALFFPAGALAGGWFGSEGLAAVSALTAVGTNVTLWILVRRNLGVWTHATLDRRMLYGGASEDSRAHRA
jgi:O-antigen/teichoic acid export membrane protein